MIWSVMLFVVHVAALAGFIYMYRGAPCWMQRLVVAGFIIAMTAVSAGYLVEFVGDIWPDLGWWGGVYFKVVGYVLEHIAVLLYVFRVIYQQHEPSRGAKSWSKSSAHSPV